MVEELRYLLILLPFAVIVGSVGGIITAWREPPARWRSYIQHLAAGLLTAIIAVDILPEVRENGEVFPVLAGFSAGSVLMLGIRRLSIYLEDDKDENGDVPYGMGITAGLDTFIDGAIVGAGFAVNVELGLLLIIALALELSVLTMAVASELRKADVSRKKTVAVTVGIALMLGAGSLTGGFLFSNLAPGQIAIVLAFSSAALLYLVTEELLAKAHDARQSTGTVFSFFLGFISLMAFTLLTGS
jgi:zinc transporter, ZIP family